MRRCQKCLLPETIPDVQFDEHGVCNYCRDHRPGMIEPDPAAREREQKELDQILRHRGKGNYDCLVGLSGGKDSSYMLYRLKEEYGLRVLAYTYDNGFLTPAARANVKQTVDKLKVDHLLCQPSFDLMRKIYVYILTRTPGSTTLDLCPLCSSFYGNIAKSLAVRLSIPVVAFGYSREQDTLHYRIERSRYYRTSLMPRELFYQILNERERTYLWQLYTDQIWKVVPRWMARFLAKHSPPSKFRYFIRTWPMVVAPFKVWGYEPEENRRKSIELGLIEKGKTHPLDTNCELVPTMYYCDFKRLGWNPFVFEYALMVREGKIDRSEWLQVFEGAEEEIEREEFRKEVIDSVLERLELTREQISAKR